MVKCLTQEHNMLVTAGLEPATFWLQVRAFIHCATHAHDMKYNRMKSAKSNVIGPLFEMGNKGPEFKSIALLIQTDMNKTFHMKYATE